MKYPYFRGLEADRYSFYRVPKALIKVDLFEKMSGDAKLLYAVLLDRMNLSLKNGWQDEDGNAYIICTIDEIMDSIRCARQKAVKLLDELEHEYQLIERRRQGLQNEFSLEENIALARQFLLENFVSRGMVVDFAVHQPDREDGGIPNPHFHVLCPIRPIEQNGKWGLKQRRVYELDEDGNRIRDANGKFVFNAVPTTDWGSPETLEHWRQTWAELCNAKFAEKGLDVRIDHRSYERQGVELLPTVHEGATVRAMEKKGIRTEKGEFNRWIKATNAVIRDIKKKIALLFDWIAEAKAELAKPQAPDLVSLLNAYYTQRRAGAYSQKGKVSNLKEMNETFNYLRANGIYTLEDLESHVNEHSSTTESLKKTLDGQTARMKAIKRLYDSSAAFQSLKPVYDGLQKI